MNREGFIKDRTSGSDSGNCDCCHLDIKKIDSLILVPKNWAKTCPWNNLDLEKNKSRWWSTDELMWVHVQSGRTALEIKWRETCMENWSLLNKFRVILCDNDIWWQCQCTHMNEWKIKYSFGYNFMQLIFLNLYIQIPWRHWKSKQNWPNIWWEFEKNRYILIT